MNTELEDYKKQVLKRARLNAVVFGTLAIIALVTLVYAFNQQGKAAKTKSDCTVESASLRVRAEKAEETLKATSIQLEQAIVDLEVAKATVEAMTPKSKK